MNGSEVVSTINVPTVQVDDVTDLSIGGQLVETRANTSVKLGRFLFRRHGIPVPVMPARTQNVAHTSHWRYIGSYPPKLESFFLPLVSLRFLCSFFCRPVFYMKR